MYAFGCVRAHDRRGDLAEIDAEIEHAIAGGVSQGAVQQAQRFDPSRQPVESLACGSVRDATRLNADQGGDHLKIVLHPVLKFQQLGVLLANQILEFVENRAVARGDQGHESEGRRSVVVLDDIGPGVHHQPGLATRKRE